MALNYAIQCTDVISGKTGTFAFDTKEYLAADKPLQFEAKSPVFNSVAELFAWAKANNVKLETRPVCHPGNTGGYVQSQLDKITPDDVGLFRVQFAGKDGGKSNWLNLTPEQYEKVKAFLIELKKEG